MSDDLDRARGGVIAATHAHWRYAVWLYGTLPLAYIVLMVALWRQGWPWAVTVLVLSGWPWPVDAVVQWRENRSIRRMIEREEI